MHGKVLKMYDNSKLSHLFNHLFFCNEMVHLKCIALCFTTLIVVHFLHQWHVSHVLASPTNLISISCLNFSILLSRFFLNENVRYLVWICRELISLILGTRLSQILGTRWYFSLILGTWIGSLKRLKKALLLSVLFSFMYLWICSQSFVTF